MKKQLLKSLLIVAAGLMAAMNVCAQPRLASEYCEANMGDVANGAPAGFTWETNAAGDIVITLSEVDGGAAGTTNFRNTNKTGNGMCNDGLGKFKVGGADATNYFERNFTLGSQVYTLKLKDGVAAPAIGTTITFSGYVEYETSVNKDCWPDLSFSYTYGSRCAALAKPTNVAISSDKAISFDNIAGATSYKAFVYWKGDVVYEQVVTNGGLLNYHPSRTGIYNVYVQAYGAEDAFSPVSDAEDWELTAELGYLPQSEWCTALYETNGANESEDVNVTWTTDAAGNVIMTLSPVDGNTQTVATELRAAMSISNLKIGDEKADASTYFNASYSGAVQTFTLIDPSVKPAYGVTFYYDGLVAYRTGTHGNCWPTLHFTHVYGSTCNGYNDHVAPVVTDFSIVDADVHSITFHVAATDEDDLGTARAIASYEISSADHGFVTTAVTPDGSGNFTVDGLADNETYTFTIHAIDLIGNVGTADREVTVEFNTELNLAERKPASAKATQGANSASKAVDGKASTLWTSYDTGEAPSWWQVDLETAYDVSRVVITFNDIAAAYKIEASTNGTDWTTIVEGATASYGETKTYSGLTMSARYFKVTCPTSTRIGIKEFEVYGTGFSVADATNPTVTVSCTAKTVTSATLQIIAADEDDAGNAGTITSINVSGDNDFVEQEVLGELVENKITFAGLKNNKTYHFTVTVMDKAGLTASQNIEVVLPFNTSYNIALDGTATAGFSESATHGAAKANDGDAENAASQWNSYGVGASEGGFANNWWQVQLDAEYNLSTIKIVSKEAHSNQYVLEGSLDGSTYYKLAEGVISAVGTDEKTVAAPARYMRFTCSNNYCSIYEFEVYASGFSTLTDAQPVVTYVKVGVVDDATAEMEIDAVDITTKPITKYMVSGIGGDPVEVTASEGKITLTSLSQSTHYTVDIQAKDGSGNLSAAKQVEFTTTGSVSNLYMYSDYFGWGDKDQERARFTTTAEPGVLTLTIANMTNGDHNFKLYNKDADRCTWNDCGGVSDHHIYNASTTNVTIYATGEDKFVTTLDNLYLRGSLVGEDKALVWNEAHTKATWIGTIDLSGTKQFTIVKKNGASQQYTYDHDFFTSVQTFDGDYEFGMFTLDVTKMTGTWGYLEIALADDATDNSDLIELYDDRMANVTINRTILADNTWYTLCLPFDMSAEKVSEVFGASTIATLESSEDRGSLIHLNFDYVDAIEAGKPYLIKVGETFNAGASINGVTIKNVDPSAEGYKAIATHMHFQGTFDKIMLTGEDKRYVSANNELYSPNPIGGSKIGAFRCYFTIPSGSSAPGKRAKIVFGPQNATGIDQIDDPSKTNGKLLINGVLYIIRDGNTYNAQGMLVE